MTLELSSKQIEKLIEIVGEKLDNDRSSFLFRLYLRLVIQAHEQGIDICDVPSVEVENQS